ncbi:MAG: SGNH/GDSL hydrolase family protein [Microbacterium sp.]|nr:MAG: SGNH/GDSL hydrolase family protein [Microbacterium sp.]
MGAYPASVSTFTVVGRLHIDEGDGIDVGADPDVNPQEGVSVTFTPQLNPKRIRVPGFGLVDIAPVAAVTDADGYVKTLGGEDVVLAYGGDPDITPTGWTWLVSIEATSVVPEDEFSIAGSAGGTVDLSEFASVSPADPGAEVVAWVSARDAAIAAKDDAEAAKAAAEAAQAAAEAVPTSNDGIVAGLVADSGSSTRGALDAAYVGRAQLDRVPAVKRGVVPSEVARVMSTPPTVGALSATSAIGSGIGAAFNGRVEGVSSSALNRSRFNFYAGKITSLGTGFPDYQFAKARYLTDPSAGNGGPGAVEFLYDGASFEFVSKGAGQKVLIVVDGEYVSKTPTTFTIDGSTYYLPVTFATAKPRKIRIEFLDQVILGFVRFEATATLTAPRTSAPFMMIAGDSFSEGVGGGYSNVPWWRTFADALGIPNVWSASLGGTGWLKTGPSGRATIRGRMATDVYPYAPDILVLAAGINDASVPYSEAAIKTEVLATIADVRENLPNTLLVVVDTFASGGVEKNVSLIPIHKGIKAACTEASVPFLSVFELPMLGVPFSTTLAANANAGATSISLAAPVAQQTTLDLGTERRVVTALSGSGPYTATVTALTYAHASGDPVSVVGGSLWTGTGRVGATTGVGNSDRLVASDNTHPTQVASDLIGLHLADQFVDLSLSA